MLLTPKQRLFFSDPRKFLNANFERRRISGFQNGATDMGIEGQFKSLTTRAQRQPVIADDGRGKNYLCDIRRFPMLERDQEYRLAKRWHEQGDRDAGNQLVTSHMRLAVKVAMG